MTDEDLRRVRADLDTMQHAAGLGGLPFAWTDVWLILGLVPTAAMTAAWTAWGPPDHLVLGVIPFLAWAVFIGTAFLWRKTAPNRELPRQEARFSLIASGAFAIGLFALVAWERFGLPYRTVRGAGFIMAGALSIPLALSHPARRHWLAMLALVPLGLFLPQCTNRAEDIMLATTCAGLAGLSAAAIMAWQLRGQDQP